MPLMEGTTHGAPGSLPSGHSRVEFVSHGLVRGQDGQSQEALARPQPHASQQCGALGESPSFRSRISAGTVYRVPQHLSPALLLVLPVTEPPPRSRRLQDGHGT